MATGKPAQIMDALFARAALMETQGPTLPVAFPEPAEQFVPPVEGKYLVVAIFPNRPAWEGVARGKLDQGILQVTVVWPKHQGIIAPAEVAALVEAHFPKGLVLSSGATNVKISAEPWTAAPLPDPDKVSLPVTINWTA